MPTVGIYSCYHENNIFFTFIQQLTGISKSLYFNKLYALFLRCLIINYIHLFVRNYKISLVSTTEINKYIMISAWEENFVCQWTRLSQINLNDIGNSPQPRLSQPARTCLLVLLGVLAPEAEKSLCLWPWSV
jgi:hypothetical protein